jgi:hypothetical protein
VVIIYVPAIIHVKELLVGFSCPIKIKVYNDATQASIAVNVGKYNMPLNQPNKYPTFLPYAALE